MPNLFLTDNRGEISNDIFREMDVQLKTNIKLGVAESPSPNGTVEKQCGIIGNMMEKNLLNIKWNLGVALAWWLSGKTFLLN